MSVFNSKDSARKDLFCVLIAMFPTLNLAEPKKIHDYVCFFEIRRKVANSTIFCEFACQHKQMIHVKKMSTPDLMVLEILHYDYNI